MMFNGWKMFVLAGVARVFVFVLLLDVYLEFMEGVSGVSSKKQDKRA